MNKEELKESFVRRYLNGDGVSEYELLFNDEEFFKDVIRAFGSWARFEKEVGILQRHIRERDKFFYYWLLKFRKDRFGDEVLRHKNIEEELKEKIQEEFGTVKYLTDTLIQKQENEALFYEVHAYLITGGNPHELKNKRLTLYAAILEKYLSEEKFFQEYSKLFIVNPLELGYEETKQEEFLLDVNTLIRMGYLTEEEAEKLKEQQEASSKEA